MPTLFSSVKSLSKSNHIYQNLIKSDQICPHLLTSVHGSPQLSRLCTTNTRPTTADPSGQLKPVQASSNVSGQFATNLDHTLISCVMAPRTLATMSSTNISYVTTPRTPGHFRPVQTSSSQLKPVCHELLYHT